MKKIILCTILAFLTASIGYCQSNIKSDCEDLLLWFQQAFETTADYGSSKTLAQRLDVRLNGLIEKYGRINVIEAVSSIAEQDKRLISPVPGIILDRLESKEEPSLILSIKSDKLIYRIGEEIKLLVTLENNSDKEIIIYWPEGSPAMVRREINAFSIVIDASMATELIYIKPKETFEKYISINLKTNLISGIYSIIMEYVPPIQFDHIINIEKQEIWSYLLTSNTIQIEVKGEKNKKIVLGRYCYRNEDCKVVVNYCNCERECMNKSIELKNCLPRDCKFGFDTLVCYCKDNQCVEGPRE